MTDAGHFDEEALIQLAEDRVDQDTHPHLIECAECRSTVGEYQSMLASFADESSWGAPLDETPNPQTIATLRAFVDQMHREDAEAEPLVAELLAGPREEWMPRLMGDAKYRTAGAVRRLIAMMPAVVRATPQEAEVIASIAVSIAETLPIADYARDETSLLRGCALRESAFALSYVGDHARASRASSEAFRAFTACTAADHEVARLRVLNAVLCRDMDDVPRGIAELKEAEAYFIASGQLERVISTLITRSALLARAGDFVTATEITKRLLSTYDLVLTDAQRAMLHGNLGYLYSERGEFVAALEEFDVAAFMFDGLDMKGDAVRNRWNVAVIFERAGRIDEALQRLREVASEFESLGMNGSAAQAAVGAAQIHVAREEYDAVEAICERAMDQFRRSGLTNSSRAMTAMALLQEASRRRHVPGALLTSVSNSVRELPDIDRTQPVMLLDQFE